jgi:hypothetical protein
VKTEHLTVFLPQGGQIGKKPTFVITAKNSVITNFQSAVGLGVTCTADTPESFEFISS